MSLVKSSILLMCCILCVAQETGARYLIITHDDYYDAVLPLAEWKTQKGLKSKITKLSEIGSDSTQIRDYVVTAYNTWQIRPEYLLLVGNKYQIPFPRRAGAVVCHTDNYYTNISGDFHNEIIPGRFWVSDTLEAMTVVSKVLAYEKEPFLGDSLWYRKGTIIIEETYDTLPGDSTYWESARYVHGLMSHAGFVHIDLFCDVFGHGSPDVIDAINDGRSYITFRGSGVGNWYQPFDNIHPEQMNNGRMLPIVVSATCATIEGIGVQWTCAGTPHEPKGMVGFFGTTTVLDYVSAERGALLKGTMESVFWDSLSTLGKAAESGRMKYFEEFNDSLEYDSWTCLGDPEMTVWTTTPQNIHVTHDSVLYAGLCTVHVNVQRNSLPAESALVCIMAKHDTSAYVYGRTDNAGSVVLVDTFNQPGDSVFITVTGRNLKPYCEYIRVTYDGPYVLLNSFAIVDSVGGNGDFLANPGEDIEIPVWLKNWGDSTADSVSAVVQTVDNNSFFTLSDTVKYFGDIPGLDSAYSTHDGFNVLISPACPDTHPIELALTIMDAHNATWTSDFSFIVHAPILSLHDFYFPGHLKTTPAGDTNALTIALKNCGSYQAEDVTGIIFSRDSFITIVDSSSSFGTITPDSVGSNESNPFFITTDPATPRCYPLDVFVAIEAGVYVDTFQFTVYVGAKDFIVWDPDPNHSSGPAIKALLDSLDYYGDYMTTFPIDYLSLFKSLFICCGVYPDNCVIYDTSQSAHDISYYLVSQSGKVYLEGGDVWVGDPQANHGYNFCPLFGIAPVSNTIGLFPGVAGVSGTFTENMLFDYQGEATMIDNIDSTGGSMVIFENTHNAYGCGVSFENRTVGLSFEMGGLVDAGAPSTKGVLIDSIMDYFGIPPTGTEEHPEHQISAIPFFAVYPNPCFGSAHIAYIIDQSNSKEAMLEIFDVSGRLVRQITLPVNDTRSLNIFHWDGKDVHQRSVSCGVYFMRMETRDFSKTEKVILLQ